MMITGKITPAAADRCVQRVLQNQNRDKSRPDPDKLLVSAVSAGSLGGEWDRTIDLLLSEAAGKVTAKMAKPCLFRVSLILPPDMTEESLKQLIRQAVDYAAALDAVVEEALCTVSDGVVRPVLQAVCLGEKYEERAGAKAAGEQKAKIGQERDIALVMAEGPGVGGCALLCSRQRLQLGGKLPDSMIRESAAWMEKIHLQGIRNVLGHSQVRSDLIRMQSIDQGGVFAALWELAGRSGCGFEVDLKAMPVRQEVVEVCECLNVHPYRLNGQGAMLFLTCEPELLCRLLWEQGVPAAQIGQTADKAVTLKNGDEIRYLEKPRQEELDRLADKAPIQP